MQALKTMLEQYRNGERGLPTYEELAALLAPVDGSKFDRFVAALEALCREHQVQLCTTGYDGIDVRDLEAGDEPIYCAGIFLDETAEGVEAWKKQREETGRTEPVGRLPFIVD